MHKNWIIRWGPALGVMLVIFLLSSRPSAELPDFGSWDSLVKKGGHMLGYGALALAYWRGFGFDRAAAGRAWLLALCYAASDELHQGFVPGRHASPIDVLFFDNLGAALAIVLWIRWSRRPASGTSIPHK